MCGLFRGENSFVFSHDFPILNPSSNAHEPDKLTGIEMRGSPEILSTRKRFSNSEPVMRRTSKNAARLGRVLGKLDMWTVEISGQCFAMCLLSINYGLYGWAMGFTAQCLPMVID